MYQFLLRRWKPWFIIIQVVDLRTTLKVEKCRNFWSKPKGNFSRCPPTKCGHYKNIKQHIHKNIQRSHIKVGLLLHSMIWLTFFQILDIPLSWVIMRVVRFCSIVTNAVVPQDVMPRFSGINFKLSLWILVVASTSLIEVLRVDVP